MIDPISSTGDGPAQNESSLFFLSLNFHIVPVARSIEPFGLSLTPNGFELRSDG